MYALFKICCTVVVVGCAQGFYFPDGFRALLNRKSEFQPMRLERNLVFDHDYSSHVNAEHRKSRQLIPYGMETVATSGEQFENQNLQEDNPTLPPITTSRPTRPVRTTKAPSPPTPPTTSAPPNCEVNCNLSTTPQWNPICASNGQTYYNEARLRCAQFCGQAISKVRLGACS